MEKDTLHTLLMVLCGVLAGILIFLGAVAYGCFPPAARSELVSAQAGTTLPGGVLCIRASAAQPAAGIRKESAMIGGQDSGLTNILIIGKDQWEGDTPGRSDCLILCSFNHNTRKITMTSFLRDLYVSIPGHSPNRINAAYALGGTRLLKETLLENYDLWIDGCVEADFSQFSRVIDLLGGVKLKLRQDEAEQINRATAGDLSEGTSLLTGEQALAYTRIRKLDRDGDFSRTERQRKVILSLLESYRDTSPLKIISIAAKVLPMLTMDMEYSRAVTTVLEVLPMLEGNRISSQHIPSQGQFRYETIRGMAVITADPGTVKSQLRESLCDLCK